jgi:hypothetical protein
VGDFWLATGGGWPAVPLGHKRLPTSQESSEGAGGWRLMARGSTWSQATPNFSRELVPRSSANQPNPNPGQATFHADVVRVTFSSTR